MSVRNVLLILHVFGAVMLIGPVTVATSIFPRHALGAVVDVTELGAVRVTHRITSGYGLASLAVPALGGALAGQSSLWAARWLQVAIGVYVCAMTVLLLVIVPSQRRVVNRLTEESPNVGGVASDDARDSAGDLAADIARDISRLRSSSGLFSLLWLGVLVLMVTKPW